MHTSQASTNRVQKLRVEYWQTIQKIDPKNLIFVDETGTNLAMNRIYARSFKGTRAYGTRPYHRGRNVTLIGAMSLSGFLGAMTIEGGTSGDVFRVYVEKILLPTLKPESVVVMDNLSAHKVTGIKELVESVVARIVYLSPYSPEFNPIENCWSKVKEFLRSAQARSRESLDEAITQCQLR